MIYTHARWARPKVIVDHGTLQTIQHRATILVTIVCSEPDRARKSIGRIASMTETFAPSLQPRFIPSPETGPGGEDAPRANARGIARPVTRDGRTGVEFAFAAYGLRAGVWLDDPGILDGVMQTLPHGWIATTPTDLDRQFRIERLEQDESPIGRDGYHLFADDEWVTWGETYDRAMVLIESEIELYVAEFARPNLFIHAGVVGWKGSAIVLPGASFAGKSTLVAALVNAGATYYSDEYAILDRNGHVHPYARPLSLRDGPLGPGGRIDLDHRAPQGENASEPLPVGMVAFTTYVPECEWHWERLTPGAAAMALCEHTIALRKRPADSFDIIGKIVSSAPAIKGVRGDTDAVVHWLMNAGCSGEEDA